MTIVDQLRSGARQQANTLTEFATRPVGVFETIDKMVRTARSTARGTVTQTGIRPPSALERFRQLRNR